MDPAQGAIHYNRDRKERSMTDWDSSAINAIDSPWEQENDEDTGCERCHAATESECICADEWRERMLERYERWFGSDD